MKNSNGYVHCPDCMKEVKSIEGESPRKYARYEFCITDNGFEVSCIRHNKKFYDFNIVEFAEFYLSDENKKARIDKIESPTCSCCGDELASHTSH